MQTWRGWTTAAAATIRAPTWAEWCAGHQRTLHEERLQALGAPTWRHAFSERDQARLSFVRWLYQTGRLGPPGYDNV